MSNDVTIDLLANDDDMQSTFDNAMQTVEEFADTMETEGAAAGQAMADNTQEGLTAMDIAMGTFLGNLATKVFDAIVSAFKRAFDAVVDLTKESFQAFTVQQDAIANVEAVLRATGNTAGFTSEQLQKMAADLQQVTRFGDEATLSAQALLLTFQNIQGLTFERTLEAAADLSTLPGMGDLTSSVRMLGRALDDPISGLTMLRRVGISFNEQQMEMIRTMVESGDLLGAQTFILDELDGRIGGLAESTGEAGLQWAQITNRFGDALEKIGEGLIPAFEAILPLIDGFTSLIENNSEVLGGFLIIVIDVAKTIKDVLVTAFRFAIDAANAFLAAVETGFVEMENTVRIAIVGVSLAVVKSFEVIKHWLTVVIPESLSWFGRNWSSVLEDLANFTTTVFKNMWENVKRFFSGLRRILGGKSANFKFKALTDGFEASMSELPKIAKRKVGDTERELSKEFDKLADKMGKTFSKRFAERSAVVDELFDFEKAPSALDAIDTTPTVNAERRGVGTMLVNKLGEAFGNFDKTMREFFGGDKLIEVETTEKDDPAKKEQKKKEESQARIEDLLSLNQRITQAAASIESPEVKATKEQTEKVEEQTSILEKIEGTATNILNNAKEFAGQQAIAALDFVKDAPGRAAEIAQNVQNFRERLNKEVTNRLDTIASNTGKTANDLLKGFGLQ